MKKMTKAMLMTALILGSVQWGGTPVHANELDTFTLDEYVVTAARTETKLVDTPANISVVTAEQIESRHYTDVAEALKDVPGANVLDGGNGTSQKPVYLNGDDRVLVLVDGRRVNSDMGLGNGRQSFDLNKLPDISLVERIEVMKGAGGALYGSDAVGGVVNVITKKADRNYGKVSVGVGSNGTEDMSAMYSFKERKTGVTVSASKYKQDYYKYRDYATDTTKRWPYDSNFENEKVSFEIEQELGEGSNITIGYDWAKYDGMGTGRVDWSSSNTKKETKNMFVKYDWTLNDNDKGYVQYYRNDQDYFFHSNMTETTNGVDLQQVLTLSDTNKMVAGFSWRESNVFNDAYYKEEKSIENIAFFLNDTWEFIPSWTLNAGIRYDDHSDAGSETTLNAGLNKKINDDSHIYVNWAQIYNAPNVDDMYYYSPGKVYPGYGYYPGNIGNPDLRPETGDTLTIGYTTKVGNDTSIGINCFESDIDNAIDWFPDENGDYRPTNVDKQKKRGMELTLNHNLNDNVNLTASYTYVNVKENMDKHGYLRDYNYMPNVYRMGINYKDGKWDTNLWLRAGTGGTSEFEGYYNGGTTVKKAYLDGSYVTVDMAITYQADKNIKVYAKGYNLFNEAYCEYAGHNGFSYQHPAQSRRFLIGAEYSF